jgi:hypothetical protein
MEPSIATVFYVAVSLLLEITLQLSLGRWAHDNKHHFSTVIAVHIKSCCCSDKQQLLGGSTGVGTGQPLVLKTVCIH